MHLLDDRNGTQQLLIGANYSMAAGHIVPLDVHVRGLAVKTLCQDLLSPDCHRGSLTSVSLVTILIRRHFFRAKFAHMVEHDPVARKLVQEVEMRQAAEEGTNMHKLLHPSRFFFTSPGGPIDSARVRSLVTRKKKNKTKNKSKVSAGMIRKVDDDDLVARTISQLQADRDAEKEGLESVELSERKSSSSAERSAEPAEPAHEAENTAQSPVLTEEPLSMQQSRQ